MTEGQPKSLEKRAPEEREMSQKGGQMSLEGVKSGLKSHLDRVPRDPSAGRGAEEDASVTDVLDSSHALKPTFDLVF